MTEETGLIVSIFFFIMLMLAWFFGDMKERNLRRRQHAESRRFREKSKLP